MTGAAQPSADFLTRLDTQTGADQGMAAVKDRVGPDAFDVPTGPRKESDPAATAEMIQFGDEIAVLAMHDGQERVAQHLPRG